MKYILYTLAMLMLFSTNSATAQNFTNNLVAVSIVSGNLDTAIEANALGITDLSFGYTTLHHNIGSANGSVRLALGTTGTSLNNVYGEARYNLSADLARAFQLYGGTSLRYQVGGTWAVQPHVGLSYDVAANLSIFTEVQNTWTFTNAFASAGGEVKLGVDYKLTDSFTLTPAIVRSFNTGADATNFRLEAKARF